MKIILLSDEEREIICSAVSDRERDEYNYANKMNILQLYSLRDVHIENAKICEKILKQLGATDECFKLF